MSGRARRGGGGSEHQDGVPQPRHQVDGAVHGLSLKGGRLAGHSGLAGDNIRFLNRR